MTESPVSMQLMFAFIVGTLVVLGMTRAQQCSPNVTNWSNYMEEPFCYNPDNQCKDNKFCLGVAIATTETHNCCEMFDSCIAANKIRTTLTYLRQLSISDTTLSTIIVCVLIAKGICSIWFANNNVCHRCMPLWLGVAILVWEIVDLGMEAAIVTEISKNPSEDFVDELKSSECFA